MKITQKHRTWKTSFEFGKDQLEYSFTHRKNKNGGVTFFQDVPPLTQTHRQKPWSAKYKALALVTFSCAVVGGMAIYIPTKPPEMQLGGVQFTAGIALVSLAAALAIYFFETKAKSPGVTIFRNNPNIRVLQDDQHDAILNEIRKRQRDVLRRKFAFNDVLGTGLSESRKFRWLLERELITDAEFAAFMTHLPSADGHLEPAPEKKTIH